VKSKGCLKNLSMAMLIIFMILIIYPIRASAEGNQKVYDFAGLLTKEETVSLEEISNKFSQKRQVDIIILTTADTEGKDVVKYMEDFYDEKGLGYDKPHGNTAILTLDMEHRDVYVAGFYKGKEYLDDSRCDLIRQKITPDLSAGNYYEAFHSFMELSYRYMGIRPGVNPENILFKLWFQVLASLAAGGIMVLIMAYNSGGRATTREGTYLDSSNSGVVDKRDVFVRTTTTKRKNPNNESKGGGGSGMGGGISGGGHSHSGSRGKF
jgi:uncharacterized protein